MYRPLISIVGLVSLLSGAPGRAEERNYSVTSFTRVRVVGPVKLVIQTGRTPTAVARGDRLAIDRLQVEVSDDLLMVGVDRSNWTGDSTAKDKGRAALYVSTGSLASLSVVGAGDVVVDKVRGGTFTLILAGSGSAAVQSLDVDQLTVGINGAGDAVLAGSAKQGKIRTQGNGNVDGVNLAVDDVEVSLIGAGNIRLKANRSAKTLLKGSGQITIDGGAACTGTRDGSGDVLCGNVEQ
jgi:hypothetical protein